MILVVPTTSAHPDYTQRTSLDGREYVLRFIYNEREQRWYLDLFDGDETPLALGLKLVANWNLLRRETDARLPPGELYAIDLSGTVDEQAAVDLDTVRILQIARDPGRDDLGADGRVALVYLDAEELGLS